MKGDEARVLLGFPPYSRPDPSQVKAAYKRKVWESRPDLFPLHQRPLAESKFKLISEAYTTLLSGARGNDPASVTYTIVKTGVGKARGERRNNAVIRVQFLLIVFGTVALGGLNAARAYKKSKRRNILPTIHFFLDR